ncbi:MAG: DUF721 domain-containing protein [Muribaculaceae bacterium]|nr:DUF721 domain-containing protein [Muribaculaceae bacterium]
MERTDAQSIGDLLRQAVEDSQGAFGFYEISAINAWPRVVGEALAAKTLRPFIRNGVMTIRVPAAPLRQELNMMRSALARAINEEAGKDVVRELRFQA